MAQVALCHATFREMTHAPFRQKRCIGSGARPAEESAAKGQRNRTDVGYYGNCGSIIWEDDTSVLTYEAIGAREDHLLRFTPHATDAHVPDGKEHKCRSWNFLRRSQKPDRRRQGT